MEAFTVTEACQKFTRPVRKTTLHRWMKAGYRGVKLAYFREGKRYFITQSAIDDFRSKTTRLDNPEITTAAGETFNRAELEMLAIELGFNPERHLKKKDRK